MAASMFLFYERKKEKKKKGERRRREKGKGMIMKEEKTRKPDILRKMRKRDMYSVKCAVKKKLRRFVLKQIKRGSTT